jgi:hypothetical protein
MPQAIAENKLLDLPQTALRSILEIRAIYAYVESLPNTQQGEFTQNNPGFASERQAFINAYSTLQLPTPLILKSHSDTASLRGSIGGGGEGSRTLGVLS